MNPMAMLSPVTALVALRGSDGEIDQLAERLLQQPAHVWVGAFSALSAADREALASNLVSRGADQQLVLEAAGYAGMGADPAAVTGGGIAVLSGAMIALMLAGLMGSAAAAAHGYSRHVHSSKPVRVLWATWWGMWGLLSLPIAFMEGFAEPER